MKVVKGNSKVNTRPDHIVRGAGVSLLDRLITIAIAVAERTSLARGDKVFDGLLEIKRELAHRRRTDPPRTPATVIHIRRYAGSRAVTP